MFRRWLTSSVLAAFGLLISSPIFASGGADITPGVILSSYDICKVSMQCEESRHGSYICSTESELISMIERDVHHIPASPSYDTLTIISEPRYYSFETEISTVDAFHDTSIPSRPYPFVRIIKIQV